jgi:kynurenine formamidase
MTNIIEYFSSKEWIWLSHSLSKSTPAYAGGDGFQIFAEKCISSGDSCNVSKLIFSNHLGSHVDAPRHFLTKGVTVDSYSPKDWIFLSPFLIDISLKEAELISVNHLAPLLFKNTYDYDLLLIRSGFELLRGERRYWESGPGLHPNLAIWLKSKFPSLRAIGIDWISVSSFQHREEGRAAHRELLGAGWRLFEDLSLAMVPGGPINIVLALPLRIEDGDGAPCTIIANVSNH